MIYRYILIILVAIIVLNCEGNKTPNEEIAEEVEEVKEYKYDIPDDSLLTISDTVDKNETLADILTSVDVPYSLVAEIASASKEIFDVRKIQPNKNYTIYKANDSLQSVQYFIYEKNPIDFVVYDLTDSINIYESKKKIEIRERTLSGNIEYSLYQTLSDIDASPKLAILFSEVFAWQIDFYTIQEDDNFKVIFEEQYIDGEFVGVRNILAANFNHRGKDHYAFRFESDGKADYFDEQANSLQKAFLKAPLKFTRISSKYQKSRLHPVLRIYRPHLGIDYAAPTGTPIVSVGDGVVTEKRWSKGGGRTLKIKHNGTYRSGYLHLSKYAKGIAPGVKVKQGQVIGYVGSTGLSTGPHLDFRFWKNNQLVNYLNMEFPPSRPVEETKKEDFMFIMNNFKRKLDLTPLPGEQLANK